MSLGTVPTVEQASLRQGKLGMEVKARLFAREGTRTRKDGGPEEESESESMPGPRLEAGMMIGTRTGE